MATIWCYSVAAFEECLKDYNCSSRAVEGYMTKHQKDCDDNRIVDCFDFAKIHKAGPYACPAEWLENQPYWTNFEDCMSGDAHFKYVCLSLEKLYSYRVAALNY